MDNGDSTYKLVCSGTKGNYERKIEVKASMYLISLSDIMPSAVGVTRQCGGHRSRRPWCYNRRQ